MKHAKPIIGAFVALAFAALPGAAMAHGGDRDHDRLPDRWEKRHGLSIKLKSLHFDNDNDGLTNLGEFRSKTRPKDADTDNDRIEDGDEDPDRDGVDNANELEEGTKPRDRDSDDDRRRDGREDADRDGLTNAGEDRTGNEPDDADTDDDGVKDGAEKAGAITSFVDGLLTIDLARGTSITALVTADTEIECETEDEHEENEHEVEDEQEDEENVEASSEVSAAHVRPATTDDEDDFDDHDGDGRDDDSDEEEPGSEQEDEGDADDVCTKADLTAGVRVHEAELELADDGALVFEELEILK